MKVYVLVNEEINNNMCQVFATRKQAENCWDRTSPITHQGYHIEELEVIE